MNTTAFARSPLTACAGKPDTCALPVTERSLSGSRLRRSALLRRLVVGSVLCVLQCACGISEGGETAQTDPTSPTAWAGAEMDEAIPETQADYTTVIRAMMSVDALSGSPAACR